MRMGQESFGTVGVPPRSAPKLTRPLLRYGSWKQHRVPLVNRVGHRGGILHFLTKAAAQLGDLRVNW